MNSKNRYKELDSLRGIAALLVVFFHFTMGREEHNFFLRIRTTGVDLFFIISGFVIFMSLQNVASDTEFVINRFTRLYPTYWASVCFTFILIISISIYRGNGITKDILIQFFGNLTMFQFYMGIPDLDGPYWTMIIEMLFYIFMLVLFQINCLKHIDRIGLVICFIIVVIKYLFPELYFINLIIKWIPLLQFFPLFFSGIIFYKLHNSLIKKTKGYLLIFSCFFCQIMLFQSSGRSVNFISWAQYGFILFIYFIIFLLFVNKNLKFIINPLTLFVGKISFALYLIHQYISLNIIIPFFYERLGINFWATVILINLPIIICIASFITYKIEIPYSKKLKLKLLGMELNN